MRPWIQNVSLADIRSGNHKYDNNTILIQIVDPAMEFPTPKYSFSNIYQFEFLDLEREATFAEEFKISKEQADYLVDTLESALHHKINVVVHCVAGVCRSGAVAEVGVIMGFEDTGAYRSPNLLVKHSMLRVLGLTYDVNEPHTINGVPFLYDELGNKQIWVPPEGGGNYGG